jgi:hypothetical protein
VASGARIVDELAAARRYQQRRRPVASTLYQHRRVEGLRWQEASVQRWLLVLRDGSEAEKLGARRGLAAVFQQRGMLAEAIELLERDIDAGDRHPETLRWLSRLYQQHDDETRGSDLTTQASPPVAPESPPAAEAPAPAAEPPAPAATAPAPSPGHRAVRHRVPAVATTAGVGMALGLGLWLLTPLLGR